MRPLVAGAEDTPLIAASTLVNESRSCSSTRSAQAPRLASALLPMRMDSLEVGRSPHLVLPKSPPPRLSRMACSSWPAYSRRSVRMASSPPDTLGCALDNARSRTALTLARKASTTVDRRSGAVNCNRRSMMLCHARADATACGHSRCRGRSLAGVIRAMRRVPPDTAVETLPLLRIASAPRCHGRGVGTQSRAMLMRLRQITLVCIVQADPHTDTTAREFPGTLPHTQSGLGCATLAGRVSKRCRESAGPLWGTSVPLYALDLPRAHLRLLSSPTPNTPGAVVGPRDGEGAARAEANTISASVANPRTPSPGTCEARAGWGGCGRRTSASTCHRMALPIKPRARTTLR